MNDENFPFYYKVSKILLIIASLLLIGNGIYRAWQSRSVGTDLYKDTIRTVESIKTEHESLRSEVESAERSAGDAEEHVNRTLDAVSRSEDTAARNAAGVDKLQTLVSECRGILETQQRIIRDVDRANGVRSAEDTKN